MENEILKDTKFKLRLFDDSCLSSFGKINLTCSRKRKNVKIDFI